jgi:hypothetical protein
MDPVTDVAVSLKLQAALVPYRTRTEEDALLDLKASKSQVATLETSLQSTNAAVALKANAADVYTRDTVDQRIATSVNTSSSTSSDAINALAQNITSAVSTLNQNLANAQTQLTTQISGKVSTDAWPGMVIAAKTEAANAANAAVQQTTQDLQAQMASKAPLQAPSFTGPVKVNGQDVVLTNDARLSIRGPTGDRGIAGPTGPAGTNGTNGTAGPTGAQGIAGVTGPAGGGAGGSKPYFFAQNGSAQTLPTSPTAATFESGLVTSSPSLVHYIGGKVAGFIAPANGFYHVSYTLNARVSVWALRPYVNGVSTYPGSMTSHPSGPSGVISGSFIIQLNASQILTLHVSSSTGSSSFYGDDGMMTVIGL